MFYADIESEPYSEWLNAYGGAQLDMLPGYWHIHMRAGDHLLSAWPGLSLVLSNCKHDERVLGASQSARLEELDCPLQASIRKISLPSINNVFNVLTEFFHDYLDLGEHLTMLHLTRCIRFIPGLCSDLFQSTQQRKLSKDYQTIQTSLTTGICYWRIVWTRNSCAYHISANPIRW